MSGIGGIVYPDALQNTNLIIPMLSTMRHRGWDQSDVVTIQNMQLGVCGGNLCMNAQKSIAVAIDGKIWNLADTLQKMKKNGAKKKECGTLEEMIIQAYELWGPSFIKRFDGEFSLVIFDHKKNKVLLYRDRIGKKPLYWYRKGNLLIFASELKALLATGAIPQTAAPDSLSAYFYFGYIPQDMTPIKGVSKLLPGHYLCFERNQGLNVCSYWSYSSFFEKPNSLEKSAIIEQINEKLLKACEVLLTDVDKYGCMISGGLGSACTAYYLQEVTKQTKIPGFTVTYQGINDEDLASAKLVAETLKMDHYSHVITPSHFLDNLTQMVWFLDEPLADPNISATWELAALCKSHVDVAFSGMGCDELFAAHARYERNKFSAPQLKNFLPSKILQPLLFPLLQKFYPAAAFRMLKLSRTNPYQFEYIMHNYIFETDTLKAVSPKLYLFFDPEVFLHKFHHLSRINSNLSSLIYFDVKTRLPDFYVLLLDRMTAAHSLEWRTPFLNKDLIEFLASLPQPDAYYPADTANYLKTLLKNVFPHAFLKRPKISRPNYLHQWVEKSELTTLFPLLQKGMLAESGFVSVEWLSENTRSIQSQKKAFQQLWAILILEIWMRLYINHPISQRPPGVTVRELLSES